MISETEDNFVKQLKANQNIVHKICRLYTSDQDAHNDLFQEITIQLWKAFPKFRGESKFTTWAYRVGLNTAITLYRKKKRSIETTPFDSEFHRIKTDEYNFYFTTSKSLKVPDVVDETLEDLIKIEKSYDTKIIKDRLENANDDIKSSLNEKGFYIETKKSLVVR